MELQPCIEETRAFGVAHCGLKALTAKKQLRTRPESLLLTPARWRGWGDLGGSACAATRRKGALKTPPAACECGSILALSQGTTTNAYSEPPIRIPLESWQLFPENKQRAGARPFPRPLAGSGADGPSKSKTGGVCGRAHRAAETGVPRANNSSTPRTPLDEILVNARCTGP